MRERARARERVLPRPGAILARESRPDAAVETPPPPRAPKASGPNAVRTPFGHYAVRTPSGPNAVRMPSGPHAVLSVCHSTASQTPFRPDGIVTALGCCVLSICRTKCAVISHDQMIKTQSTHSAHLS